jgi:hypothetical protein
MSDEKQTVEFHYIKSNLFRVTHTDGAMGGITPAGLIFVALYSERPAIPQKMVHEITEVGQVGQECADERVGKKGVVREVEVGATMSVETATNFVKWLQDKIEIVNKIKGAAEAEQREQNASIR